MTASVLLDMPTRQRAFPQIFNRLVETESYNQVFLAFGLGAVMMALGGLAEIFFGVAPGYR